MPCEALTWVEFRAQERRLDCLFSNASSVACLIYPGQNTSLQFSRVAQSCPTHCDPRDYRTSGLLVHHQLREFTQTHVHWVGDAIQPSVVPFSSCLQSFPASGSFPMSQFCASGGQRIGASAWVLPMNIQDWFPRIDWLDLLALQGTLESILQNHSSNNQLFGAQLSL